MKKILVMVVVFMMMTAFSVSSIGETYNDYRNNTWLEVFNYDFNKAIEEGENIGYDGYILNETIYCCGYSRIYLSEMTEDSSWSLADAGNIIKEFLTKNGCENVTVNVAPVGYYEPDAKLIMRTSISSTTNLSTFDEDVEIPYYGLEFLTTFW